MPVYNSNISSSNVNKLKELWEVNTHSYVTAKPLYYNNKIFVSDWQGYIYCYNAVTGELIFEKQLYTPPKQGNIIRKIPIVKLLGEPLPYMWNGFAGTGCISEGIWYLTSVGGKEGGPLTNGAAGKLYAVDLQKGDLLWESSLSDEIYSGSLAVPICDSSNVYVGTCSVEEEYYTVTKLFFKKFVATCIGEVFCFNKHSGKKIWSRKTIGLNNTDDTKAKGAGVWGGFELQSNNSLYFATGNNYGRPASKFSDSVLCVDSTDGKLRWSYQAVANDGWLPTNNEGPDFDFGSTPISFPCSKSNSGYAVGAGNKNGYLYALDSKSGELIWKTFCHVNSTPDDGIRSNITYLSKRIFIWSKNKSPRKSMSVNCIEADKGSIIWNKIYDGKSNMSTGAITNNLYFLTNHSGELYALDISNGQKIWSNYIKKASFGSNIGIYKNNIYVGAGVPALYGGTPLFSGVVCYGIV